MRSRFYWMTVAVLVLDHVTKWLVRTKMASTSPIVLIPGYLRLDYVQNTGVAFGLFHNVQSSWKPYVLAAMAVAAVVVIFVYSGRMSPGRILLQTALAITMGGILGNFVDRLAHGYVVDFIEFHVHESFHWPTFNLADSAISVGIALLLIDTIKNPEAASTPDQPSGVGQQGVDPVD